MIPKPYIAKWQENSPWNQFYQAEQDLIISRILVEIFSDDFLRENLSFRGGTAIHKLYLSPAPRYSEDIDLVQIKPGPIKPILQRIAEVLSFFESPRTTKVGGHGAKAMYRFISEYEDIPLRVKIEINCKEHFNVFEWVDFPFEIKNEWFTGISQIRTYSIDELMGTKLRAWYQRSKGRDLFDLYYAVNHTNLNLERVIRAYKKYISFSIEKKRPTAKTFLKNIEAKISDPNCEGDLEALLRLGIKYDQLAAFEWLKNELVHKFY